MSCHNLDPDRAVQGNIKIDVVLHRFTVTDFSNSRKVNKCLYFATDP